MKTSVKILLFVGGGFVVLFALFAALLIWITSDEEYAKNYEAAQIEGREFGMKTDNNGCLKEGLARARGTRLGEISKTAVKGAFVEECLDASRPVEDFCEGVPSLIALGEMDWRIEQCRISGMDDIESACLAVFDKKRFYCLNLKK